jgi:hypothetical protein
MGSCCGKISDNASPTISCATHKRPSSSALGTNSQKTEFSGFIQYVYYGTDFCEFSFLVASFVMFHSFNKNAQIRNERGHAKSANPESGTRFYTPNLAPQAWQRYVSYPSTKKPPPQPVVIYRDRLRFAERIVPVIHTPAHAHTRVC